MALSRSASKLCRRLTSVRRPLPISNANSESHKTRQRVRTCGECWIETRTNIVGTVGSIFSSARLSSRSPGHRFWPLGFILKGFMGLQRLGRDRAIDVLDRESKPNQSRSVEEEKQMPRAAPRRQNSWRTSRPIERKGCKE